MISGTSKLLRARFALTSSPISAIRELAVLQAGESIVISGKVTSYYHKQLAQEAILATCRDIELVNSVLVEATVTDQEPDIDS